MRLKKLDPEIHVNMGERDQYLENFRQEIAYMKTHGEKPGDDSESWAFHYLVTLLIEFADKDQVDVHAVLDRLLMAGPQNIGSILLILFSILPSFIEDPRGRELLDMVLLSNVPEGQRATIEDALTRGDRGVFYAFVTRQYFRQYGSRQYLIAEDFFDYFVSADFNKLTYGMLPRNVAGYVHLPKPWIDEDGTEIGWFYYAIGDLNFLPHVKLKSDSNSKGKTHKGTIMVSWFRNGFHQYIIEGIYDDEDTIMEMTQNRLYSVNTSDERTQVTKPVFFTGSSKVVLCLISYIHSGKPDMREFQNKIRMSKKNGKMEVRKKDSALAKDPVTLVGWSWKKPRHYDHKVVEIKPFPATHWVGPGKKLRKTIWRVGHEREYGKNKLLEG